MADEGARIALVLLALDRTASPAYGGLLVGAFMLPHVLAAPAVGALADRTHHRRLVHAAGPGIFAAALTIAATGAGRLPNALVILVALIGGCATPLISGGLTGLLRDLVPERRRAGIYGLDAATYNLSGIVGPAITGVIAGAASPMTATLFLAGCGLLASVLVSTLPLRHRPEMLSSPRGPAWEGVAVIWRNRSLRTATIASSFGTLGTGGLPLIVALLAIQSQTPALAGILLSTLSLGALCGSLASARWPQWSGRPEWTLVVSLLCAAVAIASAALVRDLVVDAGLFAVAGLCNAPGVVAVLSLRERAAPARLNTQVFALGAGLKISAAAVGSAAAGQLAGLDPRTLLLFVAASQTVGALIALSGRRWRHESC